MEPWFEPWMGGIFGGAIGLLGGIYGTVVGICAPRGIGRPAVMALHWFCVSVGIGFLIAAIAALANGSRDLSGMPSVCRACSARYSSSCLRP